MTRLMRSDAPRPRSGVVHLGLGAFFRAFGCLYIADAMQASGGDWGIVGVSLRSAETRDALREQGWAYSAMSLAPNGEVVRRIEVLNDVLVAPENPQAVLDTMTDPAVKIVSLTVTEKGYCHSPATGTLNAEHPDIVHDLSHDLPRSTIGFLVRALQIRKAAGLRPFTVLSCDNLPQNGRLLRGLVVEFAAAVDGNLAAWIADEARFPSTMVDRITPATTASDTDRVRQLTGFEDAAPVVHEPFAQWVIEDDFVDGLRPDLGAVGAQMVTDVTAFEHMKLKMLNGAHSALAYTGYLAGHDTIAATVADPVFAGFARGLWCEIMPAVSAPDGVSLTDYADALFDRFANPKIHHKTWQIAADGSQKLPQRILATIMQGGATPLLCLSVAAWMRYVGGIGENGAPIDVRDPLADVLRAAINGGQSPTEKVRAILARREVFSDAEAQRLTAPLTQAAEVLWANGARASIAMALASLGSD